MSHADMNNCCGFNEAAAAFSWNSPKKAINPYLDPAEVAPVSALSNLITLYAADNEQEWTITTLTHTVSPDNGFTTSLELEVKIDDFEME